MQCNVMGELKSDCNIVFSKNHIQYVGNDEYYCFCRQHRSVAEKVSDFEFIGCDRCQMWFHEKCLALNDSQKTEFRNNWWNCPLCTGNVLFPFWQDSHNSENHANSSHSSKDSAGNTKPNNKRSRAAMNIQWQNDRIDSESQSLNSNANANANELNNSDKFAINNAATEDVDEKQSVGVSTVQNNEDFANANANELNNSDNSVINSVATEDDEKQSVEVVTAQNNGNFELECGICQIKCDNTVSVPCSECNQNICFECANMHYDFIDDRCGSARHAL